MILKIIILCAALLLSVQVFGQGSAERAAYKNIQRGKWEKAYSMSTKVLRKDSLNIGASHVLAVYFFARANPDFYLDSAYHYIQKALHDFQFATEKTRERLKRNSIDSLALVFLRQQVDSAAFVLASQINTEEAYIDFLASHSMSEHRAEAVSLRNEAAYCDAVEENTYQAFNNFMIRYPDAERREDAKTQYEALLFKAMTIDKRLSSYEHYIKEYPHSPYKREVEQAIFEIRTALGTKESYRTFLDLYGDRFFSTRAQNILFHLIQEERREVEFAEYLNDSLRAVIALGRGYIVPFFHNGKFGFMNQHGEEVIQAEAGEIDLKYQCGNITDDVIVLPDKLVTPNGNLISNRTVESAEDIGYGFILLAEKSCARVIHKTGFKVGDDCIDDAKVLNEKFLALQKDSMWSIWTFAGRMLIPYEWDEVAAIEDVIVLKKNNKFTLTTARAVAEVADQQELLLPFIVDEVKVWRNDFIWVRRDEYQGVLGLALDTLVKKEMQRLSPAYFGATSVASMGVRTFNDQGEESIPFQQLEIREPWTATKIDSIWRLYDPKTRNYQSPGYDSITFEGPVAIGQGKDSATIYFSASKFLTVPQPVNVAFIPGQDSSSFLLLVQDDVKNLYSLKGERLFRVTYDHVQYAGEGFFTVLKKEKKGLITSSGKPLLPLEFDAIGTVNKGVVSLLKGNSFGLFDCNRRKLIKPQYDKNLSCYNNTVNVVFKDGSYGFADWDNKPITKVEFDEVRYWNDSAAFVRKNFEWMIYEIKTKRVLLDKIREYELINDSNDEKLAIVHQEHNYGVIHNKNGTIIPISFSDIINVGSTDEPLYFTEKNVEEASIFVVIYYDSSGKMLRKEVYEHDDYEKIYCSNN